MKGPAMLKKFLWIALGGLFLLAIAGLVILGKDTQGRDRRRMVEDARPHRGGPAIVRHGCSACHVVGGIRKATGRVGPKLPDIHEQIYIGGVLPNNPENLVRWIRFPQTFSPGTAMPDLGVSEQAARDITAYLYEN